MAHCPEEVAPRGNGRIPRGTGLGFRAGPVLPGLRCGTPPPFRALREATAIPFTLVELQSTSTSVRACLDDLFGVKAGTSSPEAPLTTVEVRLWRKFRELRHLPEDERRAVLKVVDSFLSQADRPVRRD